MGTTGCLKTMREKNSQQILQSTAHIPSRKPYRATPCRGGRGEPMISPTHLQNRLLLAGWAFGAITAAGRRMQADAAVRCHSCVVDEHPGVIS